jgi:signal transduction histidine kinase
MSATDAALGGLTNSLFAALLGIPLLFATRRALRRRWSRSHLTIAFAIAVILYAAAWTTFVTLSVMRYAPSESAAMYMKFGMLWQFVTGLLLGTAVVGACALVHNVAQLREQQERAAKAEALRARAELAALRAQLQPHFLFNALHSISAVLRSDPRGAEHAIEQLGSMLRYALGIQRDDREEVTLAEELEFVRAYLAIEQLRLGDRLRTEENIDPDALECAVLAFTLQPLVENAVRHGIAATTNGGTVRITASIEDTYLRLEVADDGVGTHAALVREHGDERGVGLRAVSQRLSTRYGGSATLRIDTALGQGFRATIVLPVSVPPVPRRPHAPVMQPATL